MSSPHRTFEDHRSIWTARDLADLDAITFELQPRHVAALERGLAAVKKRGLELCRITRNEFPVPEIALDLASLRTEVLTGRAIVLLRGFPVERYSEDDISVMYWGLGTHFGTAVSQSVIGDRIGRVTNVGDLDSNEPAYRNRRQLMPHTDRSHIIGMLCVQPAYSGGVSGYVNGLAVHNAIAAEHPECLPILYRGFRVHRFGEEYDNQGPFSGYQPVFSIRNEVPSMQYIRGYFDMAMEELNEDYTDEEQSALDLMDEVALRPEMKLDILHQPGEACFINNYVVMHSRTIFEDHDDPARKRLFLRLWLHIAEGRPLVDGTVGRRSPCRCPRAGRSQRLFHEMGARGGIVAPAEVPIS